ncbi:RNA polymerase-associated protein RapA [Synoicihabitans lomoniglobus]|uniref:RNA polymerase-associated protein RapA n=1 Tax=Synoicihabitans lomoniglobus TaxID=2909285 RepID=A0AAE9ZUU0_9BACT|nr:RNA polymerase-associated protein RapA [Opitutaceae bacterium LMO-M01]WED63489.1 RNA polymerase-associated protein RapA [Opitutaceae bacterium LMO-M01]
MSLNRIGQRCVSEPEPELGLGIVVSLDGGRIGVSFPAAGEQRLYGQGTTVLSRVQFREGQKVATRKGETFVVESVDEQDGLLVYVGGGHRIVEDEISDVAGAAGPLDRLMAGQTDEGSVFNLRHRALQAKSQFLASPVRGFLGGRLELIPHQFYILQTVTSRQIPRVLLADEVGLGKTIEACLILQRLLTVGKVKRALILVPESLTHQWFVELLRRFNLWFSIFDEQRCFDCEASDPEENPFLSDQLALCSVEFPAKHENRFEQVVAAGWDMIVVDEAHHLGWSVNADDVSPEYRLVEALAKKSRGLLLLTATPTQLGLEGHFARLRLLDPHRYSDLEAFRDEAEDFGKVAEVAEKIVEGKRLDAADHKKLAQIFDRDPDTLAEHLASLEKGKPGARDELLRTLLDQHGTGRVVFRNTRAAMTGFPSRQFCPVPLPAESPALLTRVARELEAEETGRASEIRHNFRDDPRILWLVDFLKADPSRKVLIICRTQRKVVAIEAALREKMTAKAGVFHEGLELVQRDRNAAWFAETDGAQLLICSEIGSEGRNFQFAHHLVLFDLPLNPGLVEQRIGRLDRIGQTETIRIHVPYIEGSAEACVVEWYEHGLDAFAQPMHGGNEFAQAFRERVLVLATRFGVGKKPPEPKELKALIAETAKYRAALLEKMHRGRDRLLELNSFDPQVAAEAIAAVRAADEDLTMRRIVTELMEHFGVRMKDHEEGDFFLDADHAYVEGFPSIPRDGMLATFDRQRAIVREDIRFVSADHPLVTDSLDLLINSPTGTTAFGLVEAEVPNILVEAVFVLETVADSRWHVDQFLSPQPVRMVVDLRGGDLTAEWDVATVTDLVKDVPIAPFLERPEFNPALLKNLIDGATDLAERKVVQVKTAAEQSAQAQLGADLQRLVDLSKLNDHVRPEEIKLAQQQLKKTCGAIRDARVRLDSIRLIVAGFSL